MAGCIRAYDPMTKSIFGGYGTNGPDLAALIPHDAGRAGARQEVVRS